LYYIPKDDFDYSAFLRVDRGLLPHGVRDGHHKYCQQYEDDIKHWGG